MRTSEEVTRKCRRWELIHAVDCSGVHCVYPGSDVVYVYDRQAIEVG